MLNISKIKSSIKSAISPSSIQSDTTMPVPSSVGRLMSGEEPFNTSTVAIATKALEIAEFPEMLSVALGDMDVSVTPIPGWFNKHEREFALAECIMTIGRDTSSEQLDYIAARLQELFGIITLKIYMHKEPGYLDNGKIHYDYHAHFICDFHNVKKYHLRYELPEEFSLMEEVKTYVGQYNSLLADFNDQKNILSDLKDSIPLQIEKAKQSAIDSEVKEIKSSIHEDYEGLKNKCKILQNQINSVTKELSEKKKELNQLRENMEASLKKAHEDCAIQLSEKDSSWQQKLYESIESTKEEANKSARKNIEKWEENNQNLLTTLNQRDERIKELEIRLRESENNNASLEKLRSDDYDNWSQLVEENSDLQKQCSKMKDEIEMLTHGSNDSEDIVVSLRKKNKDALSDIKKLKDGIDELNNRISLKQQHIDNLSEEIKHLQEAAASSQSLDHHTVTDNEVALQQEIVDLKKKNAEYQNTIKKLRSGLSD